MQIPGRPAGSPPTGFYPIVIVGAGPTGLTLANLLGKYGVETLVVERNASTVSEPRAVSIDDESLRTMQAVGLADIVQAEICPGYGSEYRRPSGHCFLKVEPTETPYGYPRRNAFRQPILEAQLRQGLSRFAHVEAVFGWSVTSYMQGADQIQVQVTGAGGRTAVVTCSYLIGADGASSTVRELASLTLDGETFAENWLIVDLENSPAPHRNTQVFCNAARPCIALPGPSATRRFEFKLMPGETAQEMVRPERVESLLKAHGAHASSKIVRKAIYTFHARLASAWSSGNVYLAGDACHLTPPFAGQGMNSGIRDAHNLAWKLAAVVQGRLGAGLLASYERERRDHVRAMIRLALRMGRIMAPRTRWTGWVTQTAFQLLGAWPAARSYLAEMKYKPAPRFLEGFQLPDGLGPRATRVGRLLPQPIVGLGDHHGLPLDDLLGDGFSLIAVTNDPDRFAAMMRFPEFEALSPTCLAVSVGEPRSDVDGRSGVRIITDPSASLARYIGPERALLVRPDRYVAAAFAIDDAKPTARRLGQLIEHAGVLQRCAHAASAVRTSS